MQPPFGNSHHLAKPSNLSPCEKKRSRQENISKAKIKPSQSGTLLVLSQDAFWMRSCFIDEGLLPAQTSILRREGADEDGAAP